MSCTVAAALYGGETGCSYGCLGCGDCVVACKFDAMYMDEATGLPVVIEENCVACGKCVEACPKNIIELRNVGPKSRRIFVSCVNKDKGAVAKKACAVVASALRYARTKLSLWQTIWLTSTMINANYAASAWKNVLHSPSTN
jgi:Fe-S-cluster-containing hydrogenase component 2